MGLRGEGSCHTQQLAMLARWGRGEDGGQREPLGSGTARIAPSSEVSISVTPFYLNEAEKGQTISNPAQTRRVGSSRLVKL